jgi:hypothetical protein
MVWTKQGYYICESCGTKDEIKKESGKLQDEYGSEPMIAHTRGKKQKRPADFPENSTITSETEYNPETGETKEIEYDD